MLRAVSRAIVQSEELGVSLVGTMQNQSHEVRLSRRRAAEAEALRAPIKMLFPLVVFILPTLFMLLLGPVGLRTGAALGGVFGTSRPRGQKLTVGQYVTRDVTRSVVNRVAGKVAGDLGKSMAGSMGNTIGRAIVRGTLGGLLRR